MNAGRVSATNVDLALFQVASDLHAAPRRTFKILNSIRKRFLGEVTGHEREPHEANDGQIQMAAPQSRRHNLIPSSPQSQRRCVATDPKLLLLKRTQNEQ